MELTYSIKISLVVFFYDHSHITIVHNHQEGLIYFLLHKFSISEMYISGEKIQWPDSADVFFSQNTFQQVVIGNKRLWLFVLLIILPGGIYRQTAWCVTFNPFGVIFHSDSFQLFPHFSISKLF